MYKSKQQQTLTSDVNAESYRDDDTVTIFAKREKSNKREYGERIRSQDIRIYEIFKKIYQERARRLHPTDIWY